MPKLKAKGWWLSVFMFKYQAWLLVPVPVYCQLMQKKCLITKEQCQNRSLIGHINSLFHMFTFWFDKHDYFVICLAWLCSAKNQAFLICMNQTVCACLTIATHNALFWFSLRVFRQARPLQRINCLALLENNRKVSFPRTQWCIVSSRIEPEASKFSNSNQCSTKKQRCKNATCKQKLVFEFITI